MNNWGDVTLVVAFGGCEREKMCVRERQSQRVRDSVRKERQRERERERELLASQCP